MKTLPTTKQLLFALLFFCAMGATAQTFNQTGNTTIPDCGAQVCSNINVTGLPAAINGTFGLESVTIKINHTWDSDLDIFLVAPDLTVIELSTDNGGTGNNYGSGTANNAGPYTVFHMSGAAGNVTGGAAPFTNTYIPEGDLGDANNGQNPNGTWQLCVTDDACGDTGFINAWGLTFSNTPAPPSGGGGPGHNLGDGNLTACTGDIYDTGGSGSDYSNSENITETYCSDVPGDCISLTFNDFDTEACCDDLTIYDGPNTGSPLIGTFAGTTLNGQTIQSTTGCLTFEWSSDGSVTDPGWDATITCGTCPTCSDGIQNGSETGVDCGGSVCPACPCDDITIASLPYSNTGVNTATYGDNFSSADACGSVYMNGDDVLFEYTPAVNESVNIVITNQSTTSAGLFVWDGCPDDPSTNCIQSETGANLSISCLNLTAGTTYLIGLSTWPAPQSMTFDIDITVNAGSAPTCGLNYTHSTIGYNPLPYQVGFQHNFTDDEFYSSYTSIGFDFCYDGVIYQDVLISSNGYLVFPGCYSAHPFGTAVGPNDYSEYSISAAAPNTTDAPVNAIMGPWQDIYPSNNVADGDIRSGTTGAAPNRVFATTFYEVRMFSCTGDDFNGQIMLYETSDNIEMHIGEKTVCPGFNSGAAILGLTDYTGTSAVIPAGYNYPTQWTVPTGSPEGHRFTSNCGPCTVLPVELINFSGKHMGDYNNITWTTESEQNCDYFVLERSNGGAMFHEVAKINGAGNSNITLNYSQKHMNPEPLEYYRLRQVDFNGKIAYSKIITVRNQHKAEIDIYPNPTNDVLKFDFVSESSDTYTIVVSDLVGRSFTKTYSTSDGNKQLTLNEFSELPQGFYTIKVIDGNNNVVKIDKVVKK